MKPRRARLVLNLTWLGGVAAGLLLAHGHFWWALLIGFPVGVTWAFIDERVVR